jgi:glycosyltransferase involved in cell wall biosynthesis
VGGLYFLDDYFVILTCRNSENSIRSAINSILEQTLPPENIIVVDDGSVDNTGNILRDMQSNAPHLHVITHPDRGYDIKRVVKNWNEAIRFSKEKSMRRTKFHLIATDDTLGQSHKFYEFGASMQTLGYHPFFALGRFLKYLLTGKVTGRKGALYMLYYYISYKPKKEGYDSLYEERLRQYVRNYQLKRMKKMVTRLGGRET